MERDATIARRRPDRSEPEATAASLYSKFRNRIVFPICNESGKVIAFTGRTLATDDKSGPKYLNSPETPIYSKSRVLFNLHLAKESIRRLDYIILVEGQMDCISVFNAGYHNVIASSGTAFTEPQARLLARFSKKIVVNFDPDTAGAAAAERSLALLVAEDFEIRIVTLDQGYDPDLFVRRKGAAAYGATCSSPRPNISPTSSSAPSRSFPRTAEGKVRRPSTIFCPTSSASPAASCATNSPPTSRRNCRSIPPSCARSCATSPEPAPQPSSRPPARRRSPKPRSSSCRRSPPDANSPSPSTDDNGQEQVYNPAEQAYYTLSAEQLHKGLRAESLIDAILHALAEGADLMTLPLPDDDRALFMSVVMQEHEPLTAELLHGAIGALRRRQLEQRQRELRRQIAEAAHNNDPARRRPPHAGKAGSRSRPAPRRHRLSICF